MEDGIQKQIREAFDGEWVAAKDVALRRAAGEIERLRTALLAAEGLAEAVAWYHAAPGADIAPLASALGAYRKATGENK